METPTGWNLQNRGKESQEPRRENTPEVRSGGPLYLRQVFICTSVPAHVLCAFAVCHQKLIGWPKKELENFIQAEFEKRQNASSPEIDVLKEMKSYYDLLVDSMRAEVEKLENAEEQ